MCRIKYMPIIHTLLSLGNSQSPVDLEMSMSHVSLSLSPPNHCVDVSNLEVHTHDPYSYMRDDLFSG